MHVLQAQHHSPCLVLELGDEDNLDNQITYLMIFIIKIVII